MAAAAGLEEPWAAKASGPGADGSAPVGLLSHGEQPAQQPDPFMLMHANPLWPDWGGGVAASGLPGPGSASSLDCAGLGPPEGLPMHGSHVGLLPSSPPR